jgi:ribosomal protein S18 acetylase RimI-like enzyme
LALILVGFEADPAQFAQTAQSDERGGEKTMDVLVRTASEADLDTLVALNRVIQSLHADMEPAHFKAEVEDRDVRAFFADRLRIGRNRISLAEAGGRPAGYVWFETQDLPESPFALLRRRIYVHHIGVSASSRRQGVASALLRHVEAAAAAAGIERIALSVWASNESAQSFFSAQGFAPLNLLLAKTIAKPG